MAEIQKAAKERREAAQERRELIELLNTEHPICQQCADTPPYTGPSFTTGHQDTASRLHRCVRLHCSRRKRDRFLSFGDFSFFVVAPGCPGFEAHEFKPLECRHCTHERRIHVFLRKVENQKLTLDMLRANAQIFTGVYFSDSDEEGPETQGAATPGMVQA